MAVAPPPLCPAPDPAPRRPRHAIPQGATDCHCHLFEDPARYPLGTERSYTPPLCSARDYLALMAALGLERTVQVNASAYGHDNSVTLDFIRQLGLHRARGVAGLAPDATAADIRRLHDGGIRGVRLSTMVKGYGGFDLLAPMAAKVQPFGWHLQVHVDNARELADREALLMDLPVPVVFDHLGGARGEDGVDSPGFQALLRLLAARADRWVKVSSWYRRSRSGPPAFTDMRPLAQAVIAARPDRVVWGSNWPHPVWHGPMPNDGDLLDRLCEWVADPAGLERILVSNPARLYGFD